MKAPNLAERMLQCIIAYMKSLFLHSVSIAALALQFVMNWFYLLLLFCLQFFLVNALSTFLFDIKRCILPWLCLGMLVLNLAPKNDYYSTPWVIYESMNVLCYSLLEFNIISIS